MNGRFQPKRRRTEDSDPPIPQYLTHINQIRLCLFPGNCTPGEIGAITGLNPKNVVAYLYTMEKTGEVKVIGHTRQVAQGPPSGIYELTPKGRKKVPKLPGGRR